MVASDPEARVLVVTRYVVPVDAAPGFMTAAREALAQLAARPGFLDGEIGRAADDPTLFVLATRWADVGSYRRALSSYEVKLRAVPLLSTAVDEPTAYEVLHARDPDGVHESDGALAADFAAVGLGDAAGPDIPGMPS